MSLSVPGKHSGYHIIFHSHAFLVSFWLWYSLWLTMFLITWQFWGEAKNFLKYTLVGIFLMFLSWLDWGYGFITAYQGCILSAWLTVVDVNLEHLPEVVFVIFLYCKVTLYPPSISIPESLKGSHYLEPTFEEWRVWSTAVRGSIYIIYLEFFCT